MADDVGSHCKCVAVREPGNGHLEAISCLLLQGIHSFSGAAIAFVA